MKVPEAGVDYPANWMDFQEWFPDDNACVEYLAKVRWADGFDCPVCHHTEAWVRYNGYRQCKKCKRRISATAGTVFADTRKGLRIWFAVAWYVTSQKNGISALGVQNAVGLGSYQTAWAWLHKLRRAMVRPGRDQLKGEIEVDETLIGGEEPGVRGRQTYKKTYVLILVEKRGKGMGRIRMAPIANASAKEITPVIERTVERGSTVHTDGWVSYGTLNPQHYKHISDPIGKDPKRAVELFPRVHRVASLLKRWLTGTLQGAVRPEHLQYYLDEYTFRYNRRSSKRRGMLFYRLLQQAVLVDQTPYQKLLNPNRKPTVRRKMPTFKRRTS